MGVIRDAIARRRLGVPSGGEFSSLKPYERSDSLAAIDWRASARCGDLFARKRARDAPISWSAIVDGSPSMRVRVGRTPAPEVESAAIAWRGCAGSGDAWLGVRYAATKLPESLHAALRNLPPRCALLCISDFYDLATTPCALLGVCAKRFDCTALVVCDAWANELPDGVFRVRDAESGRTIRVCMETAQRLRYARAAATREDGAAAHLRAYGWRAARLQHGRAAQALLQAFGLG